MMEKRIGLALSGGGIRALIFHLGTLRYLAEIKKMSEIKRISTVSGASLCIALVLSVNNNRWPTDTEYLEHVLPTIEKIILNNDIQSSAIFRLIFSPKWWFNRIGLLAKTLEKKWGISGSLTDLPDSPRWNINCTTFETGKNFRFSKKWMGDYKVKYVVEPDVPISVATIASAGFPILIGPYTLDASKYQWSNLKDKLDKIPSVKDKYHLWDGGVYDNLGTESLYKPAKNLIGNLNYLIISDASGSQGMFERKSNFSLANLKRLLDITMEQIEALRSREVFAHVMSKGKGIIVQIGNSAEKVVEKSKLSDDMKSQLIKECMSPKDAELAKNYPTTLSSPTKENFQLIMQHGYENTKCTYLCFGNKITEEESQEKE